MTRRNAWTIVWAVMALTALVCMLTMPPANAATLRHFTYGEFTKKFYATRDFKTAAKDRIAVSDSAASRVVKGRAVCADYTLQVFDDSTGKQLGRTVTVYCGSAEGIVWDAPKASTYHVLVTIVKPVKGATYGVAGTVWYAGRS